MRAGEFPDGAYVLRAKIDMSAPNMNMRDPTLYRIRHATHHRTGDAWCIYPTYDYAHPISDAIEGVTHSLCTLEFEDHRPLYDWVIEHTHPPSQPRQIEFARLNLNYTVMSKRKLLALVEQRMVGGWDDPRMPTIAGIRRRGFTPEAVRDFCARIGVAKKENVIDIALLEHTVREDLNRRAHRGLAVVRPLKVVIENYPEGGEEHVDAVNNPEDPAAGTRKLPFSREIYIERDDFMEVPPKKFFRLSPGSEVRLRYAYILKCERASRDASGAVTELRCTYDPESLNGATAARRVKGTIHWVSAPQAQDAEVRFYDRLFTSADPEAGGRDPLDDLNPDSFERVDRLQDRAGAHGGAAGHPLPVRAARVLLRRSGLAPWRAGLQPHGDPQGHLGEDSRQTSGNLTSISPRPFREPRCDRHCLGLVQHPIDEPWQTPRPVRRVNGGGLVDAVPPAEDVLNRQDQGVGARRIQRLDQRVAHREGQSGRLERARSILREPRPNRGNGEQRLLFLGRRAIPPGRHRFRVVRPRRRRRTWQDSRPDP